MQRLLIAPRFGVSCRQRVQKEWFGVTRVAAELFGQSNCFNPGAKLRLGLSGQKPSQAVRHGRPTWLELQRLLIMSNGLLNFANLCQDVGQVGLRFSVIGIEADGLREVRDGFLGLAHST